MRRQLILAVVLLASALGQGLTAQVRRPVAELAPAVVTTAIARGRDVRVTLKVRLPKGVHVQSDKPRDPLLIPTVLTISPPKGVTVVSITYPRPLDLKQEGQQMPLAVFEQEFTIDVRLRLAADLAAGAVVVPAQLRYQACNDTTCYPPSKADTSWTLNVPKAGSVTPPTAGGATAQKSTK